MGETKELRLIPVTPPKISWLKKCLRMYLRSQPFDEHAAHADRMVRRSFCSRRLLIVVVLIMLSLAVMGLLLFWNYQCIFVWRMCYEDHDH